MTDAPFYAQPVFWMYFAIWLPYTLLAIIYGVGSPWYQSPIGRAFWLSKLALSLILTWIMALFIFGPFGAVREVRTALFVILGLAAWYQLATVIHLQRQKRRCPDDEPHRRSTDIKE